MGIQTIGIRRVGLINPVVGKTTWGGGGVSGLSDDIIISEDSLFYFITEDDMSYIAQE